MREPITFPSAAHELIAAEWADIEVTAENREEARATLTWAVDNGEVIDWTQYPLGVRAAVRQLLAAARQEVEA